MTSSRRNKLAAGTVFLLIASAVVGGMAWATVTSLELAKLHVRQEHKQRIHRALWQLDGYIGGILNSENWREPDGYRAYQLRQPIVTISNGKLESDADLAVFPSSLRVAGPPHDWIDVYFLEQNGEISSPLFPQDGGVWTVETDYTYAPWKPRARSMFDWLTTLLPSIDLHERVACACQCSQLAGGEAGCAATSPESAARCDCAARHRAHTSVSREYQQRRISLGDSQTRYVPPTTCVDPEVAAGARRVLSARLDERPDEPPVQQARGPVGVTPDKFVAFWLGNGPDGLLKLAFVRAVQRGNEFDYQGFVGDWSRLKPELLKQIEKLPLREVDLEPVLPDAPLDSDADDTQMVNLPVRLKVADLPGGAAAAAWGEVGSKLITTWVGAGVVLVVAGWGLLNLVRLTERRMQFAYAVTHELRTPLTTFRLYADMLSAGLVPQESHDIYLETLNRESIRLSNLVEGVLEYARLEHQKVKLNVCETDGASLLQVIAEALEKRCQENGITPKTENALTNGLLLRTDIDVVNRIAGVLVNNACRHARGPADAKVLVRLAGDNGRVHVDVIDTGPGVDRADARTIFRPFRRGRKAASAAQGGIGLGLALARSWAQLLGGDVELAARHHPVYGGAHFRLTFPPRIEKT